MQNLATESLGIWAVTVAFLFFKMLFNSTLQGFAASSAKRFYFAEDAKLMGKGAPVNREPTEFMRRADALWENDLENSPIFLFLLLGYALVVGDAHHTLQMAIVFCSVRVVHAAVLLAGKQPWRTLIFLVGMGVCIWASVSIVRHVAFGA